MKRWGVHLYPVTIPVPTVLHANVGRLQWFLYLWPWEEPDDRGRRWRLWNFARGGWPHDWREQYIEVRGGGRRRVYPAPIFRFITVGPLHVRFFRQLPDA